MELSDNEDDDSNCSTPPEGVGRSHSSPFPSGGLVSRSRSGVSDTESRSPGAMGTVVTSSGERSRGQHGLAESNGADEYRGERSTLVNGGDNK